MSQILARSEIYSINKEYGEYFIRGEIRTAGNQLKRISVRVHRSDLGVIGHYYWEQRAEHEEVVGYQITASQYKQEMLQVIDNVIQDIQESLNNDNTE